MKRPALGPIDPRIRERRSEVRRRSRHRRLRVTAAVVSAGSFTLIGWGALRSPVLDVDRVRVQTAGDGRAGPGDRQTPVAHVVAASGVVGRALVDVDEATVSRRVERLPWVLRASTRRSWPATVEIEIVERKAVALVPAGPGAGNMLVDATGMVLGAAPPTARLPVLVGIAPAGRPGRRLPAAAGPLLVVADGVPASLVGRITGVAAAEGAAGVELRLRPQGIARLGSAEEVGPKLEAVMSVLGQVDVTGLAVLDVRVPSSPVLTRRAAVTKVSTAITG